MLIEQGAKAFEIWTGLSAPRDAMKRNLLGIFGEPI
jgi:shikimate dehydrogenase